MSLQPGAAVDVVVSKWGDRPHWEFVTTYLGEDEHGAWFGLPTGTSFRRPGASFTSTNDQVTLVPREGWWVATFHGPGGNTWGALDEAPVDLYVDMTTPAVVEGSTVRCVDLDLDVVRVDDGRTMVDDEDEFAEHQVTFGYPPEVVSAAQDACAAVLAAASAGTPPFDGTASRVWLSRLRAP